MEGLNLSLQLQNSLNSSSKCLANRLSIAEKVFKSVNIRIPNKEVSILKFLFDSLSEFFESVEEKKRDYSNLTLILATLNSCFSNSSRISGIDGKITSSFIEALVKNFGRVVLVESVSDVESIRTLSVMLLDIDIFQRWFTCDVVQLCRLVGSLLTGRFPPSCSQVSSILNSFIKIVKMSYFKDEFRLSFIKDVYKPLCFVPVSKEVDPRSAEELNNQIVAVIEEVLLFDFNFLHEFCSSAESSMGICIKKENGEVNDKMEDAENEESVFRNAFQFMKLLSSLPSHNSNTDEVSSSFTLFLRAVISKSQNHQITFRVFTCLCQFVGLIVEKKVSVTMCPVSDWDSKNSFKVIGRMVQVLEVYGEVPFNLDMGGYTLETCLMSLVIGMTSINLTQLTSELLFMVGAVYHFNPLLIEKTVKSITGIVLTPKTHEVFDEYTSLLTIVVNGMSSIQRLYKFIPALLVNTRSILSSQCNENVSLEDLFPSKVRSLFCESVSTLSNAQILSTIRTFIYHLEADILSEMLQGNMGTSLAVDFELLSELFVQVMFGVTIADHSVPDIVKSKFRHLMEDLKGLLQKMSEVLSELYDGRIIASFLKVCYACGAIQMLLDEYEGAPLKTIRPKDMDPFDLTFVHPYVESNDWKKICTNTAEHEDSTARNELYKLLVQKIEAVSQVEEGENGPGSQIARQLLAIASPEWLWSELTNLASLFETHELCSLVRRLVHRLEVNHEEWLRIVKRESFQENRRLVLSSAFRVMNFVAKRISKSSCSAKALKLVADEVVVEYELSQLIRCDDDLRSSVEEISRGMTVIVRSALKSKLEPDNNIKSVPHFSFFKILHALPLHHLCVESQSCIFLGILSLLHDLPENHIVDTHLFEILTNMLCSSKTKDSSKLFGGLDAGLLLKFISIRAQQYHQYEYLVRSIVLMALTDVKNSKRLMKSVSQPDTRNVWLTCTVIRALMKVNVKWDSNTEEKEMMDTSDDVIKEKSDTLNKRKCIESLNAVVIPVLETETPSSQFLPHFSLILKCSLEFGETETLGRLKPLLNGYIEIALKDLEHSEDLFMSLISHRSEMSEDFPCELLLQAWSHVLMNAEYQSLSKELTPHLLFTSSTTAELKEILSQLLSETEKEVNKPQWCNERLKGLMVLWSHLQMCTLSFEKCRIRLDWLNTLVRPVLQIRSKWASSQRNDTASVTFVLQFFAELCSAKSVELKPLVLDTIFLCLGSVPFPKDDPMCFSKHLNAACETLSALYVFRTPLILDRLPAFLQRYRLYLEVLGEHSLPESVHIAELSIVAEKLERMAKIMVKRQKDFGRLSPYLIADVLAILEKNPFHADVKVRYINIINSFLSLCDSHAVNYLSAVLPPTLQQLFKACLQNYKKFHKYVGKI